MSPFKFTHIDTPYSFKQLDANTANQIMRSHKRNATSYLDKIVFGTFLHVQTKIISNYKFPKKPIVLTAKNQITIINREVTS